MASDEEGPDFSYAYGGASWNPALRPVADGGPTPIISSRSNIETNHYKDTEDRSTDITTTTSESARGSNSQEVLDAEPGSDDDFFERYGFGTPQKPRAPSIHIAPHRDNSDEYFTEVTPKPQEETTEESSAPQIGHHAPSLSSESEAFRGVAPEQPRLYQADAHTEDLSAPLHSSPRISDEQLDIQADDAPATHFEESSGVSLGSKEEYFRGTPEQIDLPPSNLAVPLVSPTHSHAPSDGYEYQGETTFLEEAVNDDATAPLVSQTESPDIDWEATGDAWDSGEQELVPATAEMEHPDMLHTYDTQAQDVTLEAQKNNAFDWGGDAEQDVESNVNSQKPSENGSEAVNPEGSAEREFDEAFASEARGPVDTPKDDDSAAMWEALLGDDELLDDEEGADHAFFVDDDGEGFLNDSDQTGQQSSSAATIQTGAVTVASSDAKSQSASRYSPVITQEPMQRPRNIYAPQGPRFTDLSQPQQRPGIARGHTTAYGAYGAYNQQFPYAAPLHQQQQQQQPVQPTPPASTQSFVDKSKGGYASPYDLPEDLKPKRRAVLQPTVPRAVQPTPPPPPPRSSSMSGTSFAGPPPLQAPPSSMSVASLSPPSSSHSAQPSMGTFTANGGAIRPPQPATKPTTSSGFFADLPVVAKPRQATGRFVPQTSAPTPPPPQSFPPRSVTMPPSQALPSQPPPMTAQLQMPERLPPFPDVSSVLFSSQPVAVSQPAASARYSPAPASAPVGQNVDARYSPAPPADPAVGSRYPPPPPGPAPGEVSHSRYTAERTGLPRPSAHSFVPRTSSPLAQPPVLTQNQESDHQRKSSRQLRDGDVIPEEDEPVQPFSNDSMMPQQKPGTPPPPPPPRSGPPSTVTSPRRSLQSTLSPSKYAPQYQSAPPTADQSFVPPRRSQTQSPGATRHVSRQAPPVTIERPASALNPSQPMSSAPTQTINSVLSHRRGFSQEFNYVTPSDERGADPLERWKGYPIFRWGLGGTVLTTFPKHVPRYGGSQSGPVMKCVQGEVKLQYAKDLCPLAESTAKFPGPLKTKGKKKELVSWLSAQIDAMEKGTQTPILQDNMYQSSDRQFAEKILLWKIMLTLVEHDGVLEGSPAVEQAVRKVLCPSADSSSETMPVFATGADLLGATKTDTIVLQADAVNSVAVDQLRKLLSRGEREPAIWHAVDQRLWAHAMLISSTLSKDIWKQVVQEFVRKEVKRGGGDNEALAALYQVFAGNWEDSIDELVPVSARVGFQMVSKTEGVGATKNALEGLDRWRETLVLILNNRSAGDAQAILSLGKLLAGYGRIEAAHICFLFARSVAHFGGADDPQSNFTLVGADHTSVPSDLGRNMESVLLSETYEFALSLATPSVSAVPHLQAYKLYHAYTLAEYGYRNEAQQYCDAIAAAISSKTRASPYYNMIMVGHLDDLSKRLSQSPTDASSSWISKPTMGKVSSSVWAKFNHFVAGDESDAASTGSANGAKDVGPFARIAGDTPTISRSASVTDLYGSYSAAAPAPALSSSLPPGNSKYAPVSNYAPKRPQEPSRTISAYQPSRPSLELNDNTHSLRGLSANAPSRPEAHRYMSDSFATPSPYAPRPAQTPRSLGVSSPNESGTLAAYPSYGASPYQPTPPLEAPAPSPHHQSPESHAEQAPVSNLPSGYEPSQSNHEPSGTSQEPPAGSDPHTTSHEPPTSSYEPPTSSYEPPTSSYEPPTSGYEPPSYQPYEPEPENDDDDNDTPTIPIPKKKTFMDDDEDDTEELARRAAALKAAEKAKADREADEAFRKAAEADASKPAAEKKGWLSGWFKKDGNSAASPGPIKAKLGEESSFYYDTDLKKWVNKKAGAAGAAGPSPTPPPPPKGPPSRSASAADLASPAGAAPPLGSSGLAPPPARPPPAALQARSASMPPPAAAAAAAAAPPSAPVSRAGTPAGAETLAPPSRPPTSMGGASDIDDLLGAAGPRKGGTVKKGKRGGRYVDVMAAK